MPLQWVYEDIANPGPGDSALDITDRIRLYTVDFTQNAEEGAVALSSVTIDDPDGDLDIVGYRKIVAYETDASIGSNALTYNGFITDRKVTRGPYRTGSGRHWVASVADTNCLLEFRLMVGSDANRPAETDAQRVTWLLSTNEMSRIPNHDFVNLTGPVAMDAVDYRGQRGVDILNDCAQASGKNYFAFCIDAPGPVLPSAPGATHLWYDFADSVERSSIIRLSNVLDDIDEDPDGLTYAIAEDTELERDPSRVYSGALVNYDGGTAYEEDFTISAEFTRRDAVVPASNVKTNAKATARALRYLEEMSTEEDRIRTAVRLPSARVNFIREGMRVQFKATHLPGYETFTWQRVLRRTFKQDSEEEYLVTLELGTGPSEPTPSDEPDFTYSICNTEEGGIVTDRVAASEFDEFDVGGEWYFEVENTQHDVAAITESMFIKWQTPAAGEVNILPLIGCWPAGICQGYTGVPPNDICPYPVMPSGSGTFSVPSGATGFQFEAVSNGYSAPCGVPFIAECWTIRLWRVS